MSVLRAVTSGTRTTSASIADAEAGTTISGRTTSTTTISGNSAGGETRRVTSRPKPPMRSRDLRSLPAADVQGHQRVNLCRLHHNLNINLFIAGADPTTARADLDGGYAISL